MAAPVSKSWAAIEAWLLKKAKRIHKRLSAGATQQEIQQFERQAGISLPRDVAASFRLHNGADESDLFPSSEYDDQAYSLMSLDEIASDLSPAARWKKNLLPLATNGGGDYQGVDLKTGKVVEFNHETASATTLAPFWEARLADLADGLKAGRYTYDADSGIVKAEPPGQFRALRIARQYLAAGDKGVPYPIKPPPLDRSYAPVLKAVRAQKLPMRPMGQAGERALVCLCVGLNHVPKYLRHFEPEREFEHQGLRFYPLSGIIDQNEPHYCEFPKRFPVVIATTADGGRLCVDLVLNEAEPPVVLYPANVSLKGKTRKQLEGKGTIVARDVLEFMRKLTSKGWVPLPAAGTSRRAGKTF